MSEPTQNQNDKILDMIENEAGQFTASPVQGEEEAQPQAAPQLEPQQQPDENFTATAELTVGVIKQYFKTKYSDNPRIEDALKVWDEPFFAMVFIPVLKKYNLSFMNLPVELVLFGGIWKIASEMTGILKAGPADASKA